jgi:serine/threonine-protein kinase
MSLSGGTHLGPYDIVAPLGAGAMGEVYRAIDTKLKRQVAIKLLPPALAVDPDRLMRFQREAEVLASLNHPHIAAVYGFEDAADGKALVMELVEGPTLADRIAEGPIPIDEALPIAKQIAEALEAAHEQGIVHRDLKPANIKVREDGTVKVLDFGLAKLTEGAGRLGRNDPSASPAVTSPATMTVMGLVVGTAAYMSPEQARGRAVDKRTDVWAFGAVLYEILTGVRAFAGEDVTDVIAEVVKTTPNWTALPPDTPSHVVTLIQRCLEKDRNARIGDMAVARFLLAGHATLAASPAVATHASSATAPRWRQTLPWMVAALMAGAFIAGMIARRPAGAPAVTHLQMSLLPADSLSGSMDSVRPARTAMAISPDGRLVAFSATRGAAAQLFVRALDRAEAIPVPGTEGAIGPFFSPDGAWIGFWADNKIKKVSSAGGAVAAICDLPAAAAGWGASWGDDGTIFFANRFGVSKVSSAGGTPVTVTMPDASRSERQLLPQALPGGKEILFTSVSSYDWSTGNVVLHSLNGGERRVIVPGGSDARYVNTGHLVYMKNGTLMAVPFDVRSRQVTGAPVALIEGVMHAHNAPNGGDDTGAGQFAISRSGTMLYVVGGVAAIRESSLVWVDRMGAAQPLAAAPPAAYLGARLSPDGQRVAASVRGADRGPDVWVYDVLRGAPTRLTFDEGNWPVWSPDGKRLVYGASTGGVNNLYAIAVDGGGKPERLTTGDYAQTPASWASTNVIAFLQRTQSGSNGIWVLPMDGDRRPRLFLESRFTLWHPAFSPDGRWMAYASNESGGFEVYVQPYPGPGEKIRISTKGGSEPIWTANGRELLYRSFTLENHQFVSAAIRSQSPFQVDAPRLLFEAKLGIYDSTVPTRAWDVSADGQRFLLSRRIPSADKPVTVMHVVLNWTEELKRLAPAK